MHEKVLPKGSVRLLERLGVLREPALSGWTLAGGTGLALQLGHRVSEGFDFFRSDPMDLRVLHEAMEKTGSYETLQEADHVLTVLAQGTKVSFFCISDPFLFPPQGYRFFGVADVRDIALMKLIAISSRGSRKDFVDLFTILRDGPALQDYFAMLPRKYKGGRINTYHILKSLTYFEDAKTEPAPVMLEPFDWEECKRFFVRHAHAIVLPG